jgi:hypothetical protein
LSIICQQHAHFIIDKCWAVGEYQVKVLRSLIGFSNRVTPYSLTAIWQKLGWRLPNSPEEKGELMADVQISGVMPHYIDPTVEHVGVSKLRQLNATSLGKLKNMLVVRENDTALAVVLRYEQYLTMQNQLEEALRTINAYQSGELAQGVHDAAAGRIKRMNEIDPTL